MQGVAPAPVVSHPDACPRSARPYLRASIAIAGGLLFAAACSDDVTGPTADEARSYIDNLVPHHQIATMMADDALAKAVRAGLRSMAQQMKTDQTREVAELKAIRRELVGSDTTPPPMKPEPIPPGPNYDREWLLMMINHHQGAINNSTLIHGLGVSGKLDSLAHHTIDEQKREQQEMRDSLRVWYP